MLQRGVKGIGSALALFLLVNCFVSDSHAETDIIKEILKRGELRVAVQSQGPPMSFVDKKGNRAGFVIEVMKGLRVFMKG